MPLSSCRRPLARGLFQSLSRFLTLALFLALILTLACGKPASGPDATAPTPAPAVSAAPLPSSPPAAAISVAKPKPPPAVFRLVEMLPAREAKILPDEALVVVQFSAAVEKSKVRKALRFSPNPLAWHGSTMPDDRTFELTVDLEPSTRYTLTVDRGLTSDEGAPLANEATPTVTFTTGVGKPRMQLDRGIYTVQAGGPGPLLWTRNVPAVAVRCAQIPREKVAALLPELAAAIGGYDRDNAVLPWSKLGGKATALPIASPVDKWHKTAIDTASLCGGTARGVAVVEVSTQTLNTKTNTSWNEPWRQRALANTTDLGLVVKAGAASGVVWVVGLRTGKPVAGAQVAVYTRQGKQTFVGKTDGDGLVKLPANTVLSPSKPAAANVREDDHTTLDRAGLVVAAWTADDLAVAAAAWDEGFGPWRYDVPFDWSGRATTVRGLLFSDRGLYRPGETVHVKGMVRQATATGLRVPEAKVARFRVSDARDNEVLVKELPLSAFGGFDADLTVPTAAPLGDWSVSAEVGDAKLTTTFLVEEFRKRTFEVKLKADEVSAKRDRPLRYDLEARYLFGAPVQGASVAWTLLKRSHDLSFKGYESFTFGWHSSDDSEGWSDDPDAAEPAADGTGTTDDQGRLVVQVTPAPEDGADPLDYILRAEVTDAANDAVTGSTVATWYPTAAILGLDAPWYGRAGTPLAIKGAAVDQKGQPVAMRAKATLQRLDWVCTKAPESSWASNCKEVSTAIESVDVSLSGHDTPIALTAPTGGYFRVSLMADDVSGKPLQTDRSFYVGGASGARWRSDDGEKMDLVVSGQRFAAGETAHVLPRTALASGSALLTLEREGVLQAEVSPWGGAGNAFAVKLRPEHMPNVIAGVVLVRGAAPGLREHTPRMQVGLTNLAVAADAQRLQVQVALAAESYEPGQEVTVTVQLRHGDKPVRGEVALSVADEGVLLLADYQTPDPHKALYAHHNLAVRTASNWQRLLKPSDPTEHEPDEGGDAAAATRTRKRFLSSALWLPALETDDNGVAVARFFAPDNLTAFRVMAMAGDANAHLGSADKRFTVKKPLQVQPVAPRFVVPGDSVTLGALVHNHTGSGGQATVRLVAQGMQVAVAEKQVQLPAEGALRVPFEATATAQSEVTLRFEVSLGAARDSVEISLPVVERLRVDRTVVGRGRVEGTVTAAVTFDTSGLVEKDSHLTIDIDRTGLSVLQPALTELVHYPYGCLEQTLSAWGPMTQLRSLSSDVPLGGIDAAKLNDYLAAGAQKLLSFQDASGHFSLWPQGTPRPSYTVVAMHAIAAAVKAGVVLDARLVREGWSALEAWAAAAEATTGADQASLALAACTLAEAGKPSLVANQRLLAGRKTLSLYGQTYLLRALHAAKAPASQVVPVLDALVAAVQSADDRAWLPEADADHDWWWPTDDHVRPTSALLVALLAVRPTHPLLPKLAEHLIHSARRDGSWANTHDNGLAVQALAAWARAQAAGSATVSVSLGDAELARQTLRGNQALHLQVPLATLKPGTLALQAQGAVRWVARVQQARREALPPAAANGIKVTRQYLDAKTGKPLATVGAGQLVRVEVELATPTNYADVALVDPLPAGFEAANVRLGAPSMGSEDVGGEPGDGEDGEGYGGWLWQWTEMRDAEVRAFAGSLPAGSHTFGYLARALVAGTFTAAPATAEQMYQPEVRGRSAATRVVVR